jgi:2-phospho-L-lactate guanylyltransferase
VTAVLIPIKAFGAAKERLSPALDAPARTELARSLAETVVAAAHDLPVFVVCDDDDVAVWAQEHGAAVLRVDGPGLDRAVQSGVAQLTERGVATVIVAHGDLPLARDLRVADGFAGVTLVPDRVEDGTNVLAVPTAAGFVFAYGPGSFGRHLAEAQRLGLAVRVLRDAELNWDVDRPDDLDLPVRPTAGE